MLQREQGPHKSSGPRILRSPTMRDGGTPIAPAERQKKDNRRRAGWTRVAEQMNLSIFLPDQLKGSW